MTRVTLLAILCASLLALGCGDDDDSGDSESEEPDPTWCCRCEINPISCDLGFIWYDMPMYTEEMSFLACSDVCRDSLAEMGCSEPADLWSYDAVDWEDCDYLLD